MGFVLCFMLLMSTYAVANVGVEDKYEGVIHAVTGLCFIIYIVGWIMS